ncbi:TrbC/VirB2 family protein [Mollicutes bacterium LVI A0039]|nr:TrbC/VirB2 family protein [Mollicutes bacterium LVI A0039]
MKIILGKFINKILINVMILTSTEGAKNAIANSGNEIKGYGVIIATVALIVSGLGFMGTDQMREASKVKVIWIIIGLILIASAGSVAASFYFV